MLQFGRGRSRAAGFPVRISAILERGTVAALVHLSLRPSNMSKTPILSRRPVLVSVLALAGVTLTAVAYATSSPPVQDKGKHDRKSGGDQEGPLEQAMQTMQSSQKRLEGVLQKKDLAAALPLIVDMEHAAQTAKVETPPKAAAIDDAKKKAEFVNGFRKQLIGLQKALCDLEVAAIDGKADDATRIYETVIKPMKKDGHAKYKAD
jgi:hypothetical protein